jgi:hypothetical protein
VGSAPERDLMDRWARSPVRTLSMIGMQRARREGLRVFALMLLLGAGSACLEDPVADTRPLVFTLTASPTATAGQEVRIFYEVSGPDVSHIAFDYGDGADGAVEFRSGYVDAAGYTTHTYAQPGSYLVTGVAVSFADVQNREVTIEVS